MLDCIGSNLGHNSLVTVDISCVGTCYVPSENEKKKRKLNE